MTPADTKRMTPADRKYKPCYGVLLDDAVICHNTTKGIVDNNCYSANKTTGGLELFKINRNDIIIL